MSAYGRRRASEAHERSSRAFEPRSSKTGKALRPAPVYILYVKTGCPYCAKVLAYAAQHGISFEERNIADAEVADELIERGGKRQVPYLVDVEAAVEMYESDDIVEYLKGKHAR